MNSRLTTIGSIGSALLFVVFSIVTLALPQVVLAQTNPAPIVSPTVVESPKYVVETFNRPDLSTCAPGSVMVGFNLPNVGENYSNAGELNCRPTTGLTLGPITEHTKYIVESSRPASDSSCPDGSVMVGFNITNAGSNYSQQGVIYCRTLAKASLGPVTTFVKKVVENYNFNQYYQLNQFAVGWTDADRQTAQDRYALDKIVSTSCPDGSVMVGFNLLNQGQNYSNDGNIYCRRLGPTFDYNLTANNITLAQGATGQTNSATTLGNPSIKISSLFYTYCGPSPYDCFSSRSDMARHPATTTTPYSPPYYFGNEFWYYTNDVCGFGNWRSYAGVGGYNGVCNNPITRNFSTPAPTALPVTFTLASIVDAGGTNVLGRTGGTGIHFVNFGTPTVTPGAGSTISLRADANVPVGTYTATLVSNTADNSVDNRRTTTFTITVVPVDGFYLTNDGDKNVGRGGSAVTNITANIASGATYGSAGQPIALTVTSVKNTTDLNTELLGTIQGPQFSVTPFSPASLVTPTLTSALSYNVRDDSPLATYVVTVSGVSNGATRTTVFNVIVGSGQTVTATPTGGPSCVAPDPAYVTLNWSTVSGATGYNVYRDGGAGFQKRNTSPVTGLTYQDTGITQGTLYTYKIAAIVGGIEQTPMSVEVYVLGPLSCSGGGTPVVVPSCTVSPTTRTTSASPYTVTVTAAQATGGTGGYTYSFTDNTGVWSAYSASQQRTFTYTDNSPIARSFQVRAQDNAATPHVSAPLSCGTTTVTAAGPTPDFRLKGKSDYAPNGTVSTLKVKKNKPFQLYAADVVGDFDAGCRVSNTVNNSGWNDSSDQAISTYVTEKTLTQSQRLVTYRLVCRYSDGTGFTMVDRKIDVTAVDPSVEEI